MPTVLPPLSEDLIREADGLFLGLLRNALVGVYIIQDDLFRYVSPRFAEILGRSQEEICRQLGPDDLIDARDRETMRRAVADRIDGRSEAAHYSFRVERADGTPIEAEVFGMRTEFGGRPAIIGMIVDITGRRAAERAAREQLNFVSQLVEAIPSPLFHKDEHGRYLGCNKAFEVFVGRPRDEIIGRTVFELYAPAAATRYHAADQALFDTPGVQTYEANVPAADGVAHDVIFNKATYLKADGSVGGLVGVITDIT